ncbi:MAG: thiol reductant ABC exporter subunit CydD [Pseudolabrys sp.]
MPSTATPATSFLKSNARRSRDLLGWGAVCMAAGAALLVLQYWLLATAIGRVVFAQADLAEVWPRLWPIPLIVLARGALAWGIEAFSLAAAARIKQEVRGALTAKLMALGPVRLAGERTGDLTAVLVDGVEALEPYYARFLPAMANVMLVPLIALAAVLWQDWLAAVILVLTAPLIPVFMVLIGSGAEKLNQKQWAKLARMSAHFLEVLQGLTTLKWFNASRREAAIVARLSEDYRKATMSVLRVAFLSALALEFFATLGVAVVAVAVGFRLLWGDMNFVPGLFVLLLAPEFFLPLRSLGAQYHARMEAIGAGERIADILARPVPTPTPTPEPVRMPLAQPAIAFRAVSLDYGAGRMGLNDASFDIAAGRVTALVGPSGAGKSSVVNLLLGFVTPSAGNILIDGAPLDEIDLQAWRRCLAWVPQRPHLFRGSIADNIRLVAPEADDDAVAAAAREVGADAFIEALPDGYRHVIGEYGQGLSGGQVRLVALARAALRPAGLLILDEPTASLDRDSEARIGDALNRLAQGRTVLVIAHRLATVRAADTILVLNDGRVAEAGDHDALMRSGGLYAGLVRDGQAVTIEVAA